MLSYYQEGCIMGYFPEHHNDSDKKEYRICHLLEAREFMVMAAFHSLDLRVTNKIKTVIRKIDKLLLEDGESVK